MSAAVDLQIRNAARLRTDFLLFVMYFYPLLTGRPFKLSNPPGRESHFRTIARELEDCFYLRSNRLIINVPPGHGKTTMLTFYMAWCLANYPDCNFIYVSYSMPRAYGATEMCRNIVQLREFGDLFGVYVKADSRGKKEWSTTVGGKIVAFGSEGPVTGADAGLPYPLDRCTGAIILDDLHKLSDIHSDPIREGVITNFMQTMSQRPRSHVVPIIAVGQRAHEADYIAFLLKKLDGVGDGHDWRTVILKSLDDCGNALYPEVFPLKDLLIKQSVDEYTFSSQFQQEPIPAGGALFKRDQFVLLPKAPDNIVCTFLTCDTAETAKNYNCATVFSFWGLYKIEETGVWALHWIDCYEIWVEPDELESEFMRFWHDCQLFKVKPSIVAIEKKSTGVTLLSVLKKLRGMDVRDIERNAASQYAGDRYLSMKPYISTGRISLTFGDKHTDNCINHMSKITPNCTHRYDDICDTAYDAIKIGLMDTTLQNEHGKQETSDFAKDFGAALMQQEQAGATLWHRG